MQSSGQLMKLMGGSLVGTGTIAANVQNLDSTIAPGSTPGSTGILRIAGDYTHSGSGITRLQDPGLPNGREWCATYNLRDVTLGVRQA